MAGIIALNPVIVYETASDGSTEKGRLTAIIDGIKTKIGKESVHDPIR